MFKEASFSKTTDNMEIKTLVFDARFQKDIHTYIDCSNYVTEENDIVAMAIDWQTRYACQPSLTLYYSFDRTDMVYRKMNDRPLIYEGYNDQTGCAVQWHCTDDSTGLGGCTMIMTMDDGSTESIVGPWHRSFILSDTHKIGFDVDVLYKNQYDSIVPSGVHTTIGGLTLVSKFMDKVIKLLLKADVNLLFNNTVDGFTWVSIDKASHNVFCSME
ncbi:MAG: hypothetical protein RSA84_17755 [Acinetobacter sp.]